MKERAKFYLRLSYHLLVLCVIAPLIGMCLVNNRIYYAIYTEVCLILIVPYLVSIGFTCWKLMSISVVDKDKNNKLKQLSTSVVVSIIIILLILAEFIAISIYMRM